MSYDVYKEAVLRVLPEAPEIPLEAPPTEGFDLVDIQICPACGSPDATVQMVEDAEVAKCPQCQCEFTPRLEAVTRKVIRRISEHREKRLLRFMERLPVTPPVGNLDGVDYALFRKIVDGAEYRTTKVLDPENIAAALRQVRERFVEERMAGWTHPETGVYHPPVTREQAEARWLAVEPRFRATFNQPDEAVRARLRLDREVGSYAFE